MQRASPDDQAYVLAQAVLEADRTATASIGNELRNVRAEKDRFDREKRVASMHPRPSPYPTLSQTQYYRGYPYAYTQPYNLQELPCSDIRPRPPSHHPRISNRQRRQYPFKSLSAHFQRYRRWALSLFRHLLCRRQISHNLWQSYEDQLQAVLC